MSIHNSPTHKLAQRLVTILTPIREVLSKNTVKDSFDFINRIQGLNYSNKTLCSFDVSSLFTNVPLIETLSFIEEILISYDVKLPISFDTLKSLILLCTKNTQFLFNSKLVVPSKRWCSNG